MLNPARIREILETELMTDRVDDDVTTRLLGVEGEKAAKAVVRSREPGVFCGEAVVEAFQSALPKSVTVTCKVKDGKRYETDETLVELTGTVSQCLTLERTLLNTLSLQCGVATQTRKFVDAVVPHRAKILATRKTLPGLRELQLMAVQAGGGCIHRRSLSDGILIKDNHLAIVGEREILKRARVTKSPLHRVEIEVEDIAMLPVVLENPPDVLMLDNMGEETLRSALRQIAGKCEVEISGGITLDTVSAMAALGVDYISVGALTHSSPSANLTLDFVK